MNVTVINTGGTFNKVYNHLNGRLDVKSDSSSLNNIINYAHNIQFEIHNIVSKDSLDITTVDRHMILKYIKESKTNNIIVIHGTDTMSETAQFLDDYCKDKKVVLTGAMVPMSINEIEATMNFSQAIGFLNVNVPSGIYISMHGLVTAHAKIYKDKAIGKFLISSEK